MINFTRQVHINDYDISFMQNVSFIRPNVCTIFCFHGNSSIGRTFEDFAAQMISRDIQVIAPDLPGCGYSSRLNEYSMQIIGNIMSDFIRFFNIDIQYINVFGHSLGGHLIGFLNIHVAHIAIAGTPPLSSAVDFGNAFNPPDMHIKQLIPLLSQESAFNDEEALMFVTHTGVQGQLCTDMIYAAKSLTDGKFRSGCLSTLA